MKMRLSALGLILFLLQVFSMAVSAEEEIYGIKFMDIKNNCSRSLHLVSRKEGKRVEVEAFYNKYNLDQLGMPIITENNEMANVVRFDKKEAELARGLCEEMFKKLSQETNEDYSPQEKRLGEKGVDVIMLQFFDSGKTFYLYDKSLPEYSKLLRILTDAENRLDKK